MQYLECVVGCSSGKKMMNLVLETSRLYIRHWQKEDAEHFAELNADPEVMRYLPKVLTREESDHLLRIVQEGIDKHGMGFWAVEIKQTRTFIGFVGIAPVDDNLPCAPNTEIGWRLIRAAWGNGYATEAALACLNLAFQHYHLPEVVAFTAVENQRSRAVMQKLGMIYNKADDFDHPVLAVDSPIRRCVLYRIENPIKDS